MWWESAIFREQLNIGPEGRRPKPSATVARLRKTRQTRKTRYHTFVALSGETLVEVAVRRLVVAGFMFDEKENKNRFRKIDWKRVVEWVMVLIVLSIFLYPAMVFLFCGSPDLWSWCPAACDPSDVLC